MYLKSQARTYIIRPTDPLTHSLNVVNFRVSNTLHESAFFLCCARFPADLFFMSGYERERTRRLMSLQWR